MPTKKDLEKQNVDLQQELYEAQEELAEAERTATAEAKKASVPDVDLFASDLEPVNTNDEEILADPEVIRDPFAGQNPHVIKAHPPGFVLGWKSELYRGRRGWRGWEKVSYDDEYGQQLDRYITDPPARMAHGTDMYVRRGDAILCRLPEAFWLARQRQRTDKANRLSRDHAADIQVEHVGNEKSLTSETDHDRSLLRNLNRA